MNVVRLRDNKKIFFFFHYLGTNGSAEINKIQSVLLAVLLEKRRFGDVRSVAGSWLLPWSDHESEVGCRQ